MAELRTDRASKSIFLKKCLWAFGISVALLCSISIYLHESHNPSIQYLLEPSHLSGLVLVLVSAFGEIAVLAFGAAAYLLPVVFVAYVLSSFFRRHLPWGWARALSETAGLLLFIVSSCVLAQHLVSSFGIARYGPSGFVGNFILELMNPWISVYAYLPLALLTFLLALRLLFWFSWLRVFEKVGSALHFGYRKTRTTAKVSATRVQSVKERLNGFRRRRETKTERVVPNIAKTQKRADAPSVEKVELAKKPKSTPPSNPSRKKREVSSNSSMADERIPSKRPLSLPRKQLLNPVNRISSDHKTNVESRRIAQQLAEKLADFRVSAEVVSISPGPVVTRFDVQPAPGVRVNKISSLAKDLARELKVISVRVVENVPGTSVVGIEIPNQEREIVSVRDVLEACDPDAPMLELALGKDIAGNPVFADLARMPHLLVAGATGAGKSVGLNVMLMSLLYRATPDQVRLILIDPKVIELSVYDGIPHLLSPVVVDMEQSAHVLNWCVIEMERRYNLFARLSLRGLADFNRRINEAIENGEPIVDPTEEQPVEGEPIYLDPLPMIVVIVDEFADMMITVGKKTEPLIRRIAAKARAAGIHLILATQRPSVDVITGPIKANIPGRIAFQVASKTDSRTILDQGGAEQLLGWGDMLFIPPGTSMPSRVHGAYVSDDEVAAVVEHWKKQAAPEYVEEITAIENGNDSALGANIDTPEDRDELYAQVLEFFLENNAAPSISSIQRAFQIGFNRAGRIVDQMEAAHVISPPGANGKRKLLVESVD